MNRNCKKVIVILLLLSVMNSMWAKKASNQKTRTIVDQVGHTVVLPEKINRVVIASVWPLASVYCLTLGSKTLVGLDPAIISAAENSMLIKVVPNIGKISSSFSKNGTINAEELLKLHPDVVLYASGVMEDYEIATKAGIPAVGFSLSIKDYNAVETINSWVEQLGLVMGVDLSDSEYIKYGQKIEKLVADRLSGLQDSQRPECMFIHLYDNNTFTVPGLKSWADYWITASGGKNVATAYAGNSKVNAEQIASWNPKHIFIDNFNPLMPEDLYQSKVGNFNWNGIAAVSSSLVQKVPLGMYRWYVTCSDSPIMLLWMAKQNQPELFADIDLDTEIKTFYNKFYKLHLSDADVQSIYASSRAASGGIKQR
ncbi:MAG: ABC transporter substrate-binding protein [Treponema sp.]|nr:ABC transporter substrate-binding protein [Treponema sp.]